MEDERLTHDRDGIAVPECVIDLEWQQHSPDHWTAQLTDRRSHHQLQASSAPELARAISQLLKSQRDVPDADAEEALDL